MRCSTTCSVTFMVSLLSESPGQMYHTSDYHGENTSGDIRWRRGSVLSLNPLYAIKVLGSIKYFSLQKPSQIKDHEYEGVEALASRIYDNDVLISRSVFLNCHAPFFVSPRSL